MYNLGLLAALHSLGDLAQVTRPREIQHHVGSDLSERIVQLTEGVWLHGFEVEDIRVAVARSWKEQG